MYLIYNAHVVNEGRVFKGSVLVDGDSIEAIYKKEPPKDIMEKSEVIDASDCWLLPGVIDDHVHFRDPGNGESGDFHTESRAAVAGGVTSVMDMPNTNPPTIDLKSWEDKMSMAATKSMCNFSCYIAATDDNLPQLLSADASRLCGVKLFMGTTTGSMALKNAGSADRLFREVKLPIAVHAEDDEIIKKNIEHYKNLYKDKIPVNCHSGIRSEDACFRASAKAVDMALKYDTRLHLAHVSTQKELALFKNVPVDKKRITCEVCVHYLLFSSNDYEIYGTKIKCNPAIKSENDRKSLLAALATDKIDVVATDHAPHTWEAKQGDALTAASGMPGVQFSLPLMLELAKKGETGVETVVEKMCHNPAKLFCIEKRGFIRKGFKADLVIVARNKHWSLTKDKILSKCGWSPYENRSFTTQVQYTFVNGIPVFKNGEFDEAARGQELSFVR